MTNLSKNHLVFDKKQYNPREVWGSITPDLRVVCIFFKFFPNSIKSYCLFGKNLKKIHGNTQKKTVYLHSLHTR
jgi:hypothetical protein